MARSPMANDSEIWNLIYDDAYLFTLGDMAWLGATCKLMYKQYKPNEIAQCIYQTREAEADRLMRLHV